MSPAIASAIGADVGVVVIARGISLDSHGLKFFRAGISGRLSAREPNHRSGTRRTAVTRRQETMPPAHGTKNELSRRVHVELLQNVRTVGFYPRYADREKLGDVLVGVPFGDQ